MKRCETMFANEAAELCYRMGHLGHMLDIGPGAGIHLRYLEPVCSGQTSIGLASYAGFEPTIRGDYNACAFPEPFDTIWASHVLEHQLNPGAFLRKIYCDLAEHGLLAITVPPPKINLVGGHVSIWTPGTLFYHLVLAGFDCSKAKFKAYGYNMSVLVYKKSLRLPPGLIMDNGDIEKLASFFPFPVWQDMNEFPMEVNWTED